MNWFNDLPTIYLHRTPVDFRKAVNGLCGLVQDELEMNPFDESLYVFCNRKRDRIKILHWDKTGFVLWYKRLEKAKFKWPVDDLEAVIQVWLEIDWLLGTFHSNRRLAMESYARFVSHGEGLPSPLAGRKNSLILGSDEFIETNLAKLDLSENLAEYSTASRRRPPKPLEWHQESTDSRNAGIVEAYQSGRYSMKEIDDCFGLGYSMVSRVVKNSRIKT